MLGKLMNTFHIYTAHMRPALSGSSALERFERSNVIEIRNGIMIDFYPGLLFKYMYDILACTCACTTSKYIGPTTTPVIDHQYKGIGCYCITE